MKKHLPVLTLALALAMAAPLAAYAQESDAFARGVAAYEDGDYETAAELWAPLAERGAPEAQRNLAQLYRLGLGVERDNARAYDLYIAAAENNSVEAQVNAAFLLLTGDGVKKDSKQAALWFAKAADQGDALAQFNLGLMYEKGVGVPQDRQIARELYQLSANQGQERALARLDAIEEDLPPDGGVAARKEREEAKQKEKMKAEAAARERERQEADVKRLQERAKAEAEEEERSQMDKAEAEAKTGPILMIEKVSPEAPAESSVEPKQADAPKPAVKSAEVAPDSAPLSRRKPQLIQPANNRAPSSVSPARLRTAPAGQQVRAAEARYRRGDFRQAAQMLIPLAEQGVPSAQLLLGRMFNRGEGVALNHFRAYSLWRSAMDGGSERAATALANFSNRFAPEELARAEAFHQAVIQQTAQRLN